MQKEEIQSERKEGRMFVKGVGRERCIGRGGRFSRLNSKGIRTGEALRGRHRIDTRGNSRRSRDTRRKTGPRVGAA